MTMKRMETDEWNKRKYVVFFSLVHVLCLCIKNCCQWSMCNGYKVRVMDGITVWNVEHEKSLPWKKRLTRFFFFSILSIFCHKLLWHTCLTVQSFMFLSPFLPKKISYQASVQSLIFCSFSFSTIFGHFSW